MKKHHVFLTGFPRCRSAWFSNLLTHGRSFFYHDIFTHVENFGDFHHAMNVDYDVVGVCDPSLVFFWENVSSVYPDATWIVIERPFRETLESCKKAFGEFDEINLHIMKAKLEALKCRLKPHLFDFHDLNLKSVQKIAEICHTPIDRKRIALLLPMQVQLEPKYLLTKIKELQDNPTPLMRSAA